MFRLLAVIVLIILCNLSAMAASVSFTIKKLSEMGSSSVNPSVSDDGCYVAFETGPDIRLYDCKTGAVTTIAQGSQPAVSGNGEYVAFGSSVALVAADTNSNEDVYRYKRSDGSFALVSIGFDGVPGDSTSFSPTISSTGRYVAYESWASNITPGDTNNSGDIFLRDMEQPVIKNVMISVSDTEVQGYFAARNPSISAAGDRVAFHSLASNFVSDDNNGVADVFVRDWVNGRTYRVSQTASGAEANGASGTPAISGDGYSVAFSSLASNLVSNDLNGERDVFVKNLNTGAISLVSANSSAASGNGASGCNDASFSRNCLGITGGGTYVSFPSSASDLVSGDTNGYTDVFLRNVDGGTTTRVSLDFAGDQGNDESETSSISSSGRFVAFESKASLVGTHYESDLDIFLVDRGGDTPNQDVLPVVEDFSDGTRRGDPDWSVKSGSFRVNTAGQYQSVAGKNNVSLLKTLAAKPFRFSSGEIEIEIKLPNTRAYTPRAGLLFAYQNSLKYRYVQIQPGAIVFGQKGRIGSGAPLNKSKALKIKKGTTYTLRVKLQSDGRMLIYVGDRLVSSYKFKKAESGAVGVFSPRTQAYFDNLHIF